MFLDADLPVWATGLHGYLEALGKRQDNRSMRGPLVASAGLLLDAAAIPPFEIDPGDTTTFQRSDIEFVAKARGLAFTISWLSNSPALKAYLESRPQVEHAGVATMMHRRDLIVQKISMLHTFLDDHDASTAFLPAEVVAWGYDETELIARNQATLRDLFALPRVAQYVEKSAQSHVAVLTEQHLNLTGKSLNPIQQAMIVLEFAEAIKATTSGLLHFNQRIHSEHPRRDQILQRLSLKADLPKAGFEEIRNLKDQIEQLGTQPLDESSMPLWLRQFLEQELIAQRKSAKGYSNASLYEYICVKMVREAHLNFTGFNAAPN